MIDRVQTEGQDATEDNCFDLIGFHQRDVYHSNNRAASMKASCLINVHDNHPKKNFESTTTLNWPTSHAARVTKYNRQSLRNIKSMSLCEQTKTVLQKINGQYYVKNKQHIGSKKICGPEKL